MGSADDSVIARHARENAFCLITRDKDFGDIRNYPPGDYGGIIILDLPDDFPVAEVLRILEMFLSRKEWLEAIAGTARDCRPITGAVSPELADSLWQTPSQPGKQTLIAGATDSLGRTQPLHHDPDRGTYMIYHLLPIEVEVVL